MAVYERYAGAFLAERIQTEPGSDEDKRLAALVEAGAGWRRADSADTPKPSARKPKQPPKAE